MTEPLALSVQAEYVREKIDWAYIAFADNQPILSLIEDKLPMGIVPILDEQCRFPKSDHLTFAEKLFQDFKSHTYFEKPKFAKVRNYNNFCFPVEL